jgi:hypothetical protein
MKIAKTADAVKALLHVTKYNKDGTLRLVGAVTTETVTLQQPAVTVGTGDTEVAALDVDNDAHWMDIVFDGTTYVLDADNVARGVPFTGVMRLVKSAGVSANEFGVEYV